MELKDTCGNRRLPAIGSPVLVRIGLVRRRDVLGKAVRVTAQQVRVEYQANDNMARRRTEAFWKKNGRRVGDADMYAGPHIRIGDQ